MQIDCLRTEDLKTDLLGKISELREEFAALKNHPLPSNTILDSSVTNPSHSISSMERTQMPASPQDIPPITSTQLVRPTDPGNEADVASGYPALDGVNANDVNKKPRKIVITGDSLLHGMNIHKMKVNNISLNSKVNKERRHYQWLYCSLYEICGKAQ